MKEIIKAFLKNGYLLNPDLIRSLNKLDYDKFLEEINEKENKPLFLNEDIKRAVYDKKDFFNIDWQEFDKARSLFEQQNEKKIYETFLNILNQNFKELNLKNEDQDKSFYKTEIEENTDLNSNLIILKNYDHINKRMDVDSFTEHYRQRYKILKDILMTRQELQNAVSINHLQNRYEHEKAIIIGLVNDKKTTKNGNLLLTLEDPTGIINAVVSKNKTQLFLEANDILFDEVIGISGSSGDKIIFVDNLYFPGIPTTNKLKKSDEDVYIAFTSDLQVGNKLFYEKSFLKFISWLNLEYGDKKQKEIAKKVKYLFLPGDLIEGVGVYPGQEEDLIIQDIYKQYGKLAEYLGRIRKDVKIILTPGNHDGIQIAEPQPSYEKKVAPALHELPNIYFTTNPSLVNVASTKSFSGFNILIYHGYSFFYIAENVDSIRKAGRIERPDLIMQYQLKRRHLAPSHSSTLYLPNSKEDPLIIEKIPDFFISGHLHKTIVTNYNNITIANCSCWIGQTEDQLRRGIMPDPCKVILVNLKTREIKILNFKEDE
jgi:DNA polymerase II small subunit